MHFSLDVLWKKQGQEPCLLVPGQAFPIATTPPTGAKDRNDTNGTTEMVAYTSLFQDDKVFTDTSDAPLSKQYIAKSGLMDYAYAHSAGNGFGVTRFLPQDEIPGCFTKNGRRVLPLALRELFEREAKAEYCTGPACHMHMIPSIFCKLFSTAPERVGDVELYDVELGEVCRFRKIALPLVLGSFDETEHPNTTWKTKLYQDATSPSGAKYSLLHTMLGLIRDPVSGGIVFYDTRYYYAFPSLAPDPNLLPISKREKIKTALLPPPDHDAWEDIDIGRRRVIGWEEQMCNAYRA